MTAEGLVERWDQIDGRYPAHASKLSILPANNEAHPGFLPVRAQSSTVLVRTGVGGVGGAVPGSVVQ